MVNPLGLLYASRALYLSAPPLCLVFNSRLKVIFLDIMSMDRHHMVISRIFSLAITTLWHNRFIAERSFYRDKRQIALVLLLDALLLVLRILFVLDEYIVYESLYRTDFYPEHLPQF